MRRLALIALAAALASCRGEPVPRDYQNAPPAMTHPPTTSSQTPTAEGMGQAPPEPTPATETAPTATSTPDTPPVTTTT